MSTDQGNQERQRHDALLRHPLLVWKDIEEDQKENRRTYPEAHKNLEGIASALQRGAPILPIALGQLLRWFGAERRGRRINRVIRTALTIHNIRVRPNLNQGTLDDNVWFESGPEFFTFPKGFRPRPPEEGQLIDKNEAFVLNQIWQEVFLDVLIGWMDANPGRTHDEILAKSEELQNLDPDEFLKFETPIPIPENPLPIEDSTLRVGSLKAAKTELAYVSPTDTIADAITIMEQRGYSQLPVMTGRRTVKGMITWRSICLWLYRGGDRLGKVQDCMAVPSTECPIDTPLIEAIDEVVEHEYIVIRDKSDNTLSGILTATDFARQLRELAEPFLCLMEIENHIRWLILDACFTVEELRTAADVRHENRYIRNIDDLTLGEYINLLSQNQAQSKLKVRIELKYLTAQLREIIRIRNSIMHFKLEPISDGDLEKLRGCVAFLQRARGLKDIG